MNVHLRMLGCRLNQSEMDSMAREFQRQGHTVTDHADHADWVVVNTCAVTQDAVRASRKLIRDLHRANENAQITVTGCYAQLAPDVMQTMQGVVQVIDNLGKDTLVQQITGQPPETFDHEPIARETRAGAYGRTRAFIKVQDGCDNKCTFCVTTIARGAGRSKSPAEIVNEINFLHQSGYQEAVLTGVHLGSYGHDHGDPLGLMHLVETIIAETDIPRLRLSSLEPWDLSPEFFDLWRNSRVCPHLHLPLQSGCDATLKRMLRHTHQVAFSALVAAARQRIPNLKLTTDIIVGFPGETDAEFADSEAFIRAMDFAGLHVFRYSKRPGTAAARMRDHVDERIKKQRSAQLLALNETLEAAFAQRYVGAVVPVLWEQINGATDAGFINMGYTDNYIRVQAVHPRVLTNHITSTRLESYDTILHGAPIIDGV